MKGEAKEDFEQIDRALFHLVKISLWQSSSSAGTWSSVLLF
jgi:hypothetical protein